MFRIKGCCSLVASENNESSDRVESIGSWSVRSLLALQAVGLLLSALIFAITFASSEQVVARLQAFAVSETESYARTALDGIEARLSQTQEDGGALSMLAERLAAEAERTEALREHLVPQIVAYALSKADTDHCVPSVLLAGITNSALVSRAANLRIGESTAKDLIVHRYEQTLSGLIKDLRRFGGVNLVAFALMIGLLLGRNVFNWRFVAFSVGLFFVTAYMVHWYFFGQNWGQVILFQNWAAMTYQITLIFACCVMFDWLFLGGFVTQSIVNAITSLWA